MICLIQGPAHGDNVARHTGCGFILSGEYPLDLMILIRLQDLGVLLYRHTLAPIDFEGLDIELVALAEIDPEVTEMPKARHQDFIARGQGIGHGGLPSAGAGGWKDKYLAGLRFKDLFDILKQRQSKPWQIQRPHILLRDMHGVHDTLGDVGRSWDEKEITSGHVELSSDL